MNTIDHRPIESVLRLAAQALGAAGIECVISGETTLRVVSGATLPDMGHLALADIDQPQLLVDAGIAVVVHPLTGSSGESGWIAAIRPADAPFDDTSIATAASATQLIEDQLDRSLEQSRLTELGAALRANQDQLRTTRDRLEASNGELEQFAYIAAHELVSPLRAVAIYAELLGDIANGEAASAPDPNAVSSASSAIRTGVAQMQEHVQQLLQLTRVESDPSPLVPTDLNLVAQRAIDVLAVDINALDASVTLDELPTVLGQSVQLQSVFANLLGNAIRYRSPERTLEITVSSRSTADGVEVSVTDNGIGVAEQDRQRVFSMFERGANDDVGFGIGLSLTRRILERHDASISLEASASGGCTFTIRFS